jgi:drug/metabolite transporter (DMT)-like permease
VVLGLCAAFGAALAYGVASALQGLAAGRSDDSTTVDPRAVVRLLRQWPFLVGTGLDVVGFLLGLVALRSLALFVVQAAVAANLAVTAVVAAGFMHHRLARREWGAVGAATAGLVLVGLAAGHEGAARNASIVAWALLGASVLLAVVGFGIDQLVADAGAGVLGAVAGLGFGIVALAGRVLPGFHLGELVRSPATWALALAGAASFTVWTSALQRGAVTIATAAMVVGETLLPALVGVVFLGDSGRHGWAPAGAVGFAVSVGGALALSRFGEVVEGPETPAVRPAAR